MIIKKIYIVILLTALVTNIQAQVRIRIFADKPAESAIFTVTSGTYTAETFNGDFLTINKNEPLVIARMKGRLVLKANDKPGVVCDSIKFTGSDSSSTFSVRINGKSPLRQFYDGDLICYPDLGTVLLINIPDIEEYIAGVVRAEGGSGKNREYFRTQAVIARTYMYKYFGKHLPDKYNLCDNTHCQAYNGVVSDTAISNATHDTHNQVIISQDSILIISAFHSNCGGETASSKDVWLTSMPYLRKVTDPYCTSSRNALWERTVALDDWINILNKAGYDGQVKDPSPFSFSQASRPVVYKTGNFTIPVNSIRNELKLRSTYFSVAADTSGVILKGRGYGHGVGLCQEGAMVMASKGFNYRQIIGFYYFDVIITDIKNARPGIP
jgi:stage II sporulation protein D